MRDLVRSQGRLSAGWPRALPEAASIRRGEGETQLSQKHSEQKRGDGKAWGDVGSGTVL